MRFVVDLFRYIVLAGVAVLLVGGSFLLFTALSSGTNSSIFSGLSIATAIGFFVLGVISLGGLAGLISTHDRIAEISDHLDEISESLNTIAYHSSRCDNEDPRIG